MLVVVKDVFTSADVGVKLIIIFNTFFSTYKAAITNMA